MVSSKPLKYSHKNTCISKKVQEQNDKTATKKEILLNDNNEAETVYEPVEVTLPIKQVRNETLRELKNRMKQDRIKLMFSKVV